MRGAYANLELAVDVEVFGPKRDAQCLRAKDVVGRRLAHLIDKVGSEIGLTKLISRAKEAGA